VARNFLESLKSQPNLNDYNLGWQAIFAEFSKASPEEESAQIMNETAKIVISSLLGIEFIPASLENYHLDRFAHKSAQELKKSAEASLLRRGYFEDDNKDESRFINIKDPNPPDLATILLTTVFHLVPGDEKQSLDD